MKLRYLVIGALCMTAVVMQSEQRKRSTSYRSKKHTRRSSEEKKIRREIDFLIKKRTKNDGNLENHDRIKFQHLTVDLRKFDQKTADRLWAEESQLEAEKLGKSIAADIAKDARAEIDVLRKNGNLTRESILRLGRLLHSIWLYDEIEAEKLSSEFQQPIKELSMDISAKIDAFRKQGIKNLKYEEIMELRSLISDMSSINGPEGRRLADEFQLPIEGSCCDELSGPELYSVTKELNGLFGRPDKQNESWLERVHTLIERLWRIGEGCDAEGKDSNYKKFAHQYEKIMGKKFVPEFSEMD